MSDVLLIIANRGFEDAEYRAIRAALDAGGHHVVVGSDARTNAVGALGTVVTPCVTLRGTRIDRFAGVVFVGGIGARAFFQDADAHRLAREAAARDLVLGAICLAPAILAEAGVLRGRPGTVHETGRARFLAGGGVLENAPVVCSGRLVTGRDPDAAPAFAAAIASLLGDARAPGTAVLAGGCSFGYDPGRLGLA